MPLLLLLILLQEKPVAEPQERMPARQAEFGPIAGYWFPRFKGSMRVDGSTTTGTDLNFVNDLGLPDDASIPIYGGGLIGATFNDPKSTRTHLSFVAEYWSHSWGGFETLKQPTTLGDHSFAAGIPMESRFTLTTLTLDAAYWGESEYLAGGVQISIQYCSTRLRMDSLGVGTSETIDDLYWGGGGFLEFRPIPFTAIGLSARGYTSFGDAGETGAGDFRVYGALRWDPFRLEGGYRTILHDRDTGSESINYTLYGAYVQVSVILRF